MGRYHKSYFSAEQEVYRSLARGSGDDESYGWTGNRFLTECSVDIDKFHGVPSGLALHCQNRLDLTTSMSFCCKPCRPLFANAGSSNTFLAFVSYTGTYVILR